MINKIPNVKIIALGHKARQGKDVCASYMCSQLEGARIYHWADALKEEVAFSDIPKILRYGNDIFFNNGIDMHAPNLSIQAKNTIIEWCDNNNISPDGGVYYGSKEKDSILLQFWGTDYRRNNFGQDYWVERTISKIQEDYSNDQSIKYAIIPDTRFLNEYSTAKCMGGLYIEVQRYEVLPVTPASDRNELQITRYIDRSRDPNHPSECELDDIKTDFLITAMSGDIPSIHMQADYIINKIKMREHSVQAVFETNHY